VLGIIGSAGRKEDRAKLLEGKLWVSAQYLVLDFIKTHGIKELVSGGAARADQLAVQLFNKGLVEHLVLALPAPFDEKTKRFIEKGFKSPGSTANYYHSIQFKDTGRDTLAELALAIAKGAEIIVGDGMFNRNSIVASRAEKMLAITFGEKSRLKDGGAADTMKKFIKKKDAENSFHLDLNSMEVYNPATLS